MSKAISSGVLPRCISAVALPLPQACAERDERYRALIRSLQEDVGALRAENRVLMAAKQVGG